MFLIVSNLFVLSVKCRSWAHGILIQGEDMYSYVFPCILVTPYKGCLHIPMFFPFGRNMSYLGSTVYRMLTCVDDSLYYKNELVGLHSFLADILLLGHFLSAS
ncbi:hypothetical protein DsansV1_C14g0129101 [Dioscorea sansibarensis]